VHAYQFFKSNGQTGNPTYGMGVVYNIYIQAHSGVLKRLCYIPHTRGVQAVITGGYWLKPLTA
jgi:hypothetical protein